MPIRFAPKGRCPFCGKDTFHRVVSIRFPVKAFLGITSRTPHFRREDVADRLLLFHVTRFESFEAESGLLAELMEHREMILTDLVEDLQAVVRILRDTQGQRHPCRFRMADFADFALKVAHGTGQGERMGKARRRWLAISPKAEECGTAEAEGVPPG